MNTNDKHKPIGGTDILLTSLDYLAYTYILYILKYSSYFKKNRRKNFLWRLLRPQKTHLLRTRDTDVKLKSPCEKRLIEKDNTIT